MVSTFVEVIVASLVIGAVIGLAGTYLEKRYAGDETGFMLALVGGMTGLFLLFLIGSGLWFVVIEGWRP
ncbi:hypothetical protein [Aeromicrobium alkaliterrae]|uniref:hypothetical protein n=1 Tax=Aeromicrobium alkaliterrae TaxID=302168 RepID=UPI0031DBA4B8